MLSPWEEGGSALTPMLTPLEFSEWVGSPNGLTRVEGGLYAIGLV